MWDYPFEALREAVINAICHRDYRYDSEIQLKIYEDSLTIWNPGGLPPELTIDDLYDPRHASRPRNRLIAEVFYDIMLIEKYGSGIPRIIEACKRNRIPIPKFEEKFCGFLITFRKDFYTIEDIEKLRNQGFEDNQINTIIYIKENGKITNVEYQMLNNVKKRQAAYGLNKLIEKGIIERIRKGGKTYYQFKQS